MMGGANTKKKEIKRRKVDHVQLFTVVSAVEILRLNFVIVNTPILIMLGFR